MIYWSLSVSFFCLGLHPRTVLLGIMRSLPSTFCQMVLLPFVGDACEIYFLEWSCDAWHSWLLKGLLRWNMLCHGLVACGHVINIVELWDSCICAIVTNVVWQTVCSAECTSLKSLQQGNPICLDFKVSTIGPCFLHVVQSTPLAFRLFGKASD